VEKGGASRKKTCTGKLGERKGTTGQDQGTIINFKKSQGGGEPPLKLDHSTLGVGESIA